MFLILASLFLLSLSIFLAWDAYLKACLLRGQTCLENLTLDGASQSSLVPSCPISYSQSDQQVRHFCRCLLLKALPTYSSAIRFLTRMLSLEHHLHIYVCLCLTLTSMSASWSLESSSKRPCLGELTNRDCSSEWTDSCTEELVVEMCRHKM